MKLIIDIPEERSKWIKEHKGLPDFQTATMLNDAAVNGTPLPENPTNGDMFKALFPNYIYAGVNVLYENEHGMSVLLHDVNYNWWIAPYQNEKEED